MSRVFVRLRQTARRCAGAAAYGCALSWWCAYGVTYTAFGVAFTAAALVVSTLAAGLCAIFSGE